MIVCPSGEVAYKHAVSGSYLIWLNALLTSSLKIVMSFKGTPADHARWTISARRSAMVGQLAAPHRTSAASLDQGEFNGCPDSCAVLSLQNLPRGFSGWACHVMLLWCKFRRIGSGRSCLERSMACLSLAILTACHWTAGRTRRWIGRGGRKSGCRTKSSGRSLPAPSRARWRSLGRSGSPAKVFTHLSWVKPNEHSACIFLMVSMMPSRRTSLVWSSRIRDRAVGSWRNNSEPAAAAVDSALEVSYIGKILCK